MDFSWWLEMPWSEWPHVLFSRNDLRPTPYAFWWWLEKKQSTLVVAGEKLLGYKGETPATASCQTPATDHSILTESR
jgi:hypothetical protein